MHASSALHCALRIQATAARTDHVRHKRCLTIGHSQLHPLNLMRLDTAYACTHQTHIQGQAGSMSEIIQEQAVITQPAPCVAHPDQPWTMDGLQPPTNWAAASKGVVFHVA
jgi:hypothetical protein